MAYWLANSASELAKRLHSVQLFKGLVQLSMYFYFFRSNLCRNKGARDAIRALLF